MEDEELNLQIERLREKNNAVKENQDGNDDFDNVWEDENFSEISKNKKDSISLDEKKAKGFGIISMQVCLVLVVLITVLIMNIFYKTQVKEFLNVFKLNIQESDSVVEKAYETIGKFITGINEKDNQKDIEKEIEKEIDKDSEKAKAKDKETQSSGGGIGGGENIENLQLPKNITMSQVIFTGDVVFPLDNKKITSPFAFRKSPFTNKAQFHNALDLSAPTGTKIHCATSGTVIKAEENATLGKHIIIDCGAGFKVTYAHCSRLIAKVGMQIKTNEIIAEVGSTGDSSGPHLHFATSINDKYFNPEYIFNTKYIFEEK